MGSEALQLSLFQPGAKPRIEIEHQRADPLLGQEQPRRDSALAIEMLGQVAGRKHLGHRRQHHRHRPRRIARPTRARPPPNSPAASPPTTAPAARATSRPPIRRPAKPAMRNACEMPTAPPAPPPATRSARSSTSRRTSGRTIAGRHCPTCRRSAASRPRPREWRSAETPARGMSPISICATVTNNVQPISQNHKRAVGDGPFSRRVHAVMK